MKFDDTTYDQIEAFLDGGMSAEESNQFENAISQDAELQQEVELHRLANEAILADMTFQVQGEVQAHFALKRKATLNRNWLIGGAVLLVGFLTWYLWPTEEVAVNQGALSETVAEKQQSEGEVLAGSETEEKLLPPAMVDERLPVQMEESTPEIEPAHEHQHQLMMSSPVDEVQEEMTDVETEAPSGVETDEVPVINILPSCDGVEIQVDITTSASCYDENNGGLSVRPRGGTAPYSINLVDEGALSATGVFNGLGPGEYLVEVTDKNGCRSAELLPIVEAKECFKPKSSFNPEFETWRYQSDLEEIRVEVKDAAGRTVYSFKGDELEWDGTSTSGSLCPVGSYLYLVYKNGELIDKNYLSIVY